MTTSTLNASTASDADWPRTFVDTNVLIYAHDPSETIKQPVASVLLDTLWSTRRGTMSTQVLQEFYNTVTRKVATPLAPAAAREIVAQYTAWPIVIVRPDLILSASMLHEQHQLSFWDALIVEAARVAGAERILTEDMQHGQVVAGVRIENPFLAQAGSVGAEETDG